MTIEQKVNIGSTVKYADIAIDIYRNKVKGPYISLKTYKTMGGKILLMPENDAYEPFMIDEDQFSILGVAIGIIK